MHLHEFQDTGTFFDLGVNVLITAFEWVSIELL